MHNPPHHHHCIVFAISVSLSLLNVHFFSSSNLIFYFSFSILSYALSTPPFSSQLAFHFHFFVFTFTFTFFFYFDIPFYCPHHQYCQSVIVSRERSMTDEIWRCKNYRLNIRYIWRCQSLYWNAGPGLLNSCCQCLFTYSMESHFFTVLFEEDTRYLKNRKNSCRNRCFWPCLSLAGTAIV